MKKCPKCGTETSSTSQICQKCFSYIGNSENYYTYRNIDTDIEIKVKEIIVEQLYLVDITEVVPSASFIDDLGADSLDLVELKMAFEEKFGIEISDEDAEQIHYVGQAIEYISMRTKSTNKNYDYVNEENQEQEEYSYEGFEKRVENLKKRVEGLKKTVEDLKKGSKTFEEVNNLLTEEYDSKKRCKQCGAIQEHPLQQICPKCGTKNAF